MNLALWVFVALFSLLMIFDGLAILFGGYKATVSSQVYRFSTRFPVIAFALGFFLGHLFWPNLGACKDYEPVQRTRVMIGVHDNQIGEKYPSADGCNECTYMGTGMSVCTALACGDSVKVIK